MFDPTRPVPRATLRLGPQVIHLKLEGPRLIDVAPRLARIDVQVVVNGVLVEGLGALARQDVREAGWVRQAEDAPALASCQFWSQISDGGRWGMGYKGDPSKKKKKRGKRLTKAPRLAHKRWRYSRAS